MPKLAVGLHLIISAATADKAVIEHENAIT
jgi:hypothetical protein